MADINTYAFGQDVELTFTFKNDAGVLTDPTTATVYIQPQNDVLQTYDLADLTRESQGIYTYNVIGNRAGAWLYRTESTGAVATGGQKYFMVQTPEPA